MQNIINLLQTHKTGDEFEFKYRAESLDCFALVERLLLNKTIKALEPTYYIHYNMYSPVKKTDRLRIKKFEGSDNLQYEEKSRKGAIRDGIFNITVSEEKILKKEEVSPLLCDLEYIENNYDMKRIISRIELKLDSYKNWKLSLSNVESTSKLNKDTVQTGEIEVEFIGNNKNDIIKEYSSIKNYIIRILYENGFEFPTNPSYVFNNIFKHIDNHSKYIPTSIKPINSVEILTQNIWRELKQSLYSSNGIGELYITNKIDGVRKIITNDSSYIYIVNNREDIKKYPITKQISTFVIDCEEYNITIDGKKHTIYFIFDIYYYNKRNVSKNKFSEKLSMFPEIKKYIDNLNIPGVSSAIKKFTRLYEKNMVVALTEFMNVPNFKLNNTTIETDGYIIVDGIEGKSYKYKLQNTIDFSMYKIPNVDTNTYYMCVTISKDQLTKYGLPDHLILSDFTKDVLGEEREDIDKNMMGGNNEKRNITKFPIKFVSSVKSTKDVHKYTFMDNNDYHGKIVEMFFDKDRKAWNVIKIRDDRMIGDGYYGNNYMYAELNYLISSYGFDIKSQGGYFNSSNENKSNEIRSTLNKLKKHCFEKYKGECIIDIGGGRGQDLYKYGNGDTLFVIEKDSDAIIELMTRRLGVNSPSYVPNKYMKMTNRLTACICADITSPSKIIDNQIKSSHEIPAEYFDVAYCNLAVHYFFDDKTSINNALRNVSKYLKQGGKIVITYLSGTKIYDMLESVSYNGEYVVNDVYSIKKKYKSKQDFGTKIGMKLPFTGDDEFYPENLVFTNTLKQICADNDLTYVETITVDMLKDDVVTKNISKLSENELKYLNTHESIIFEKK
jgi:SAM-dependent methyltransferase